MITLYSKDSKGELRVWSIFTEGPEVVVKHGKLGGKITEKRYAAEGKNIGKANETSASEQAVLEAEAKYVKQLKSGYFPTQEEALDFEEFTPMKAQDYKKHAKKIKYPCIMQPKLNGQRLMIDAQGNAWSKQGEPLQLPNHWKDGYWNVPHVAKSLLGADGEVYAGLESKGGLSLQRIISAFRKPNEDTPKLKYYVYDIPVSADQLTRFNELETFTVPEKDDSPVVIVSGVYVETQDQGDNLYQEWVDAGYEGAIYRNLDGEYEFGKRSYNLIKRKPRSTAEAIVKSVDKDRNGWGVLNCETFTGVEFRCQMKVDAGDKNFRLYDNALELIGKTIEYEYEEESDDGVPTKPVGVGIREVDKFGRPVI